MANRQFIMMLRIRSTTNIAFFVSRQAWATNTQASVNLVNIEGSCVAKKGSA